MAIPRSPAFSGRKILHKLFLSSLLSGVLVAGQTSSLSAQVIPTDAEWRSFATEHFVVNFQVGLDSLASRAATRAEWAYDVLSERFVEPPDGRVQIVLTDNLDYANGFASTIPRNRIVVQAFPPAEDLALAFHDDWLQQLILHELVHVFHLDNSAGIWNPLRRVLGRDPALFPQVLTPGWLIEGLATFYESEFTEGGRLNGTNFRMIARTAILDDAFFSLDRASLDPVVWPAGNTRYVYGSLFVEYLASQAGAERVGDFIDRLGRQIIPYRPGAAARRAMGLDLGAAWTAWQDSLRSEVSAQMERIDDRPITRPTLLTGDGRAASHPRFSPNGERIAYFAATGRADADYRIITPGGRLLETVEKPGLGGPVWIGPDSLLFAQLEFSSPYDLPADLVMATPGRGFRRITRSARVWDPDIHPDGSRAVAIQAVAGTNRLVLVDLGVGDVTPLTDTDLDVYWSGPRWSPDGRLLAVSRWTRGRRMDIVLIDPLSGDIVREIASTPALETQPAWSRDGEHIFFTSDRTGIPNIFVADPRGGDVKQVTNVETGAFYPEPSPDLSSLVFAWYRADGFHIASIPLDAEQWWAPDPPILAAGTVPEYPATPRTSTEPYSPFPSLWPTYWSPALEIDEDEYGLGVSVAGEDVIERHSWAGDVLVYPSEKRVEAGAGYRYLGWENPALGLSAGQDWSTNVERSHLNLPDVLRRQREGSASLTFLRRRLRSTGWLQTGADVEDGQLVERGSGTVVRDWPTEVGGSVGVGISTVRGFGLSLGPQTGASGSLRLQGRRYLDPLPDGTSSEYWRATVRSQAYRAFDWFGFAPPTVALRLDGAVEGTANASGFSLGGASGQSSGFIYEPGFLGSSGSYPVRGFPSGFQRGNRVVSGTAEYRFPIRLIERGFGLLPVALDRLWGDVFVDAGAAWCPSAACPEFAGASPTSPDPLVSVGVEGVVGLRIGFLADLPLRFGLALPVRGDSSSLTGYIRVGSSF